MNKLTVIVAACVGLLVLTLPAVVQGQEVYPGELKRDYGPDAGQVGDTIPWYWHPQDAAGATGYNNVAGIKFTLKYDPHEVAILGINPTFVAGQATNAGHYNFPAPGQVPESSFDPEPASEVPATVVGTVWLDHNVANNSGTNLSTSVEYPIFDLRYQPLHTHHVNDPDGQFNSEVDVVVSELRPIVHPDPVHMNSVYKRVHVKPGNPLISTSKPPATHIVTSVSYWEHGNSVTGVLVKVSDTYFPGPLATLSTIPEPSGIHVQSTVIPPSEYIHSPTTGWEHNFSSILLTQFLLPQSVFVVGATVAGEHLGLDIDHVPEPVSLALLGTGGFALLVQMWIRRRRRRTA